MSELFPAESVAMKSPRLRWMDKHGIKCDFSTYSEPGREWCAYFVLRCSPGGVPTDLDACGFGPTATDALQDIAMLHLIPLWNEEEGA